MLNMLGIFFGVGAISVPLLAVFVEGHLAIPQLFLICAVLASLCAATYALLRFPKAATPQAVSLRDLYAVSKYDGLMLLASILFMESGNEASIGGWTSTYVNSGGYLPRTATLVLAVFWAALMLSRMSAARILKAWGKSQVVFGNALLAVLGSLILLFARSLLLLFIGTALIGSAYGPIFPTTLAIAGDRYRERAGTVFGLLFSIALLGGMLFPWTVGHVSQRFSVHTGMIVPLTGALAITLLSGIVILRNRYPGRVSKTNKASL
jgi:FHS family glucose/mannose:H+ symporter-like MFS transporter